MRKNIVNEGRYKMNKVKLKVFNIKYVHDMSLYSQLYVFSLHSSFLVIRTYLNLIILINY